MNYKNSNITYLLIPILLLVCLMTIALIKYPMLFSTATSAIIITFSAIIVYIILWKLLKPDSLSKNWELIVGFLFIINISVEDFSFRQCLLKKQ